MVVLIPSCDLNPESAYYYQNVAKGAYLDVANLIDPSREHLEECPDVPLDEINNRIEKFVPKDESKEMFAVL